MSRRRRYDDFVVRLGGRAGGAEGPLESGIEHEVDVEGYGRQGGGTFVAPFSPQEISHLFARLGGRNLTAQPAAPTPGLTPREAGERLFTGLMQEEVRRLFEQSVTEARLRGRGLRLVFKADPRRADRAALLALPWELLYRPDDRRFLALDRRQSVVRFAEIPAGSSTAPARSLLRVLVAAACPKDLPRLEVARELAEVRCALRGRALVRAEFLTGAGLEAVRERLLAGRHHVLHFIGHGDYDAPSGVGSLLFEGEGGAAEPVSGEELAANLVDLGDLGLVVLNACSTADGATGPGVNPFAGVATALIRDGVPRVLAMQAPITDRAAIAFSRAFYGRLAAGDPVDAAAVEGRFAIVGANRRRRPSAAANLSVAATVAEERPEWAVPVLFLRADGALRRVLPGRRLALPMFVLLALGVWLGWRLPADQEVRLHVGDFEVEGGESPADDRAAGVRDALLQKLSAVSGRPRIRLTCSRCPELDRDRNRRLEVDYHLHGEVRVGERPEVVVEIYDREELLVDRVVVRSAEGDGVDVLGVTQELTLAILDRLGVRLDPQAVAVLAGTPTADPAALELNNEGVALLLADELAEAAGKFRAALGADPGYAAAAANLAEVEARRGNYEKSAAGYRTAIKGLPDFPVFHFGLGYLLLHRRPSDPAAGAAAALPSLQRAVELDPGYAEAHNELGNALFELGRLGAAGRAFAQAAGIAPDAPQPRKNLARIAFAEDRPHEALAHLDEALQRLPATDRLGRAEVVAWEIEAHARQGAGAEVCKAASDLERLDPERVSPWAHQAAARVEEWGCGGDSTGAPR